MAQLFFCLEYNLSPLQPILRATGSSVFLPYEPEIGLSQKADDAVIIAKIAEQKRDLGIDRIIITRDKKFITHLGRMDVKLIVLLDKTGRYDLYQMNLKDLGAAIIAVAVTMAGKTQNPGVAYVECSRLY